jgi:hypothetical protein
LNPASALVDKPESPEVDVLPDVPSAPARVLAKSVLDVVVVAANDGDVAGGDTSDWICAMRAEISDRDNGRSRWQFGRVRAPRVITRPSAVDLGI